MTRTKVQAAPASPLSPAVVAQRFQALADEKRIRILDLLRAGERCVCELGGDLRVGQSLLSFHLKTLREAGLVSDRRDGRWVHYSLAPEVLAELEAALSSLRADAEASVAMMCCSEESRGAFLPRTHQTLAGRGTNG